MEAKHSSRDASQKSRRNDELEPGSQEWEKHLRAQFFTKLILQRLGSVPTDEAEAFEWYRRRAEAGDPDAQWMLCKAYWGGKGVRRNETKALKWMILAAERHPDDDIRAVISYYREGIPHLFGDWSRSERMAREWEPKADAGER